MAGPACLSRLPVPLTASRSLPALGAQAKVQKAGCFEPPAHGARALTAAASATAILAASARRIHPATSHRCSLRGRVARFAAAGAGMPTLHDMIEVLLHPKEQVQFQDLGDVGASLKEGVARFAAAGAGMPTLHVGLVGYGLVGQELVGQMCAAAPKLEKEIGVRIEIAAVSRSRTMALLPAGTASFTEWPESQEEAADLKKLGQHVVDLAAASGGRALIVDNTASDAPAEMYEAWLLAGADEKIMEASRKSGARFLYEATVGAGLPVVGPLQALLRAGDEVDTVEGIFSGTLSYIFNTWKPGVKFSEVVKEAKDKGFTEPDPRDDLGGTDVQRKVTILAREIGLKIELDDVPVKSLVPEKLQNWEAPDGKKLGDAFVEELTAYDDEMDALLEEAEKANEVLRFVGSVDVKSGKASVKLGRFPKDV
eukprot:s3551_g2.t2